MHLFEIAAYSGFKTGKAIFGGHLIPDRAYLMPERFDLPTSVFNLLADFAQVGFGHHFAQVGFGHHFVQVGFGRHLVTHGLDCRRDEVDEVLIVGILVAHGRMVAHKTLKPRRADSRCLLRSFRIERGGKERLGYGLGAVVVDS